MNGAVRPRWALCGLQLASVAAGGLSWLAVAVLLRPAGDVALWAMLLGVLDNQPGAAREIVALNAGTALYTANVVDSIGAGIQLARETLASGAARAKMEAFIACTQKFA